MKKILLLAAFLLSFAPAFSETQVLDKDNVATAYSTVVDGWTYITNAAEFMKLVKECQNTYDTPKKIRLACDIEYPQRLSTTDISISDYFIKYFRGTFDGMGCTIKNLNIQTYGVRESDNNTNIGFIQQLDSDSEVCNLRFDDCNIVAGHSGGTVAIVVNNVVGTDVSIHDIYIKRGTISVDNVNSEEKVVGCLVCDINSRTEIKHCAIDSLNISGQKVAGNILGFFGTRMNDGASVSGCSIEDCYLASTPTSASVYARFSCITQYDRKDFDDNKLNRHSNCFWDSNIRILGETSGSNPYDIDFFETRAVLINKISLEDLKSGDSSKLNDTEDVWMCQKDSLPKPAGLFYWIPEKENEIKVGTYGESQTLKGKATSTEYGRYIESAILILTSVNNQGKTNYVIDDQYTNEIGVRNPFKEIKENVFKDISMTTLKLPGLVTTVQGNKFLHGVTEGFISNGYWRYAENCLYLNTNQVSRLMTVVGNNEELTIDGRYCTSIFGGALDGQSNLKNLYLNTWFPVGSEGPFEPIELDADNIFKDCPDDMNVYVKDGTMSQAIIGSDITEGYKETDNGWDIFYNEWEDDNNHLFQYFPVTRNPAGLSTLVLGYPVKLPSDCRAWVATGTDNGKLTLKRVVGNIVPAGLPVLLSYENTSGIMHLSPYLGTAPASTLYEGSIFRGSLDPTGHKMTASERMANFYTLSRLAGSTDWSTVAFRPYHPTNDILPSYVVWIGIQDVNAKLSMVFDGDYELPETNGIADAAEQEASSSVPAYNLSGQRVGSNYRGMIIKNGRKYIAK